MPILQDLDRRLDSLPFDREEFDRRLPTSQAVADRVPLVHVHGDKVAFSELLKNQPHQLEVTKDGVATRDAELQLGLERSVYFFAGRVFPHGRGFLSLGFTPTIETGRDGSVTPFDTGGLVAGHIQLDLGPHMNAASKLDYGKTSVLPLVGWRSELARVLAAYFDRDLDYWDSRPARSDPERIYELNSAWQAWTFEIRFHEGPSVYECATWSVDEGHLEKLRELDDFMEQQGGDVLQKWDAFWKCRLAAAPHGSISFRRLMEVWVEKQVS